MDINTALVSRLVAVQFPEWARLRIRPVEVSGWDNRTFHLGERMSVRLPSAACYANQISKEFSWLPKLAPRLPLAIASPLAMGEPGEGYPWPWGIYKWIEGTAASLETVENLPQFARDLGAFLVALQNEATLGGPQGGAHNFYRGGDLAVYDLATRNAIAAMRGSNKAKELTKIWDTALASTWQKPAVWVHGDIAAGNLLVSQGQLCAVIDFGQLAIGDPACDLSIAWTLFNKESRKAFRDAVTLDTDTWARARGWTLWKALCAAFPRRKSIDEQTIAQLIAEGQGKE